MKILTDERVAQLTSKCFNSFSGYASPGSITEAIRQAEQEVLAGVADLIESEKLWDSIPDDTESPITYIAEQLRQS